jgi:hypothetical protein
LLLDHLDADASQPESTQQNLQGTPQRMRGIDSRLGPQ